jgi:hypothetical protein
MKRFKVNTTFEEDELERKRYFAGLSYKERLMYYFKVRDLTNFHKGKVKMFYLKICDKGLPPAPYI